MHDLWVVNASPLIALAKVEQLTLLEHLAGEVLIPEAVVREILVGPATDPARAALDAGWGTRVVPTTIPNVLIEGNQRGRTKASQ